MVAKIFYKRFAESGDKDPVPDAAASDGSVSYEQGYSADYSRKLGVDPLAKNVERLKLNRVLFEMTDGIRELQSGAARPFDSNLATAIGGYPKWSAVTNAAGDLFDSLADGNTAPTTDASKWRQRVLYQIASQAEAEGGNDNAKIMTALRTNQYIAKNVSPAIAALQNKDTSHDASIQALNNSKFDKTGGNITGAITFNGSASIAPDATGANLSITGTTVNFERVPTVPNTPSAEDSSKAANMHMVQVVGNARLASANAYTDSKFASSGVIDQNGIVDIGPLRIEWHHLSIGDIPSGGTGTKTNVQFSTHYLRVPSVTVGPMIEQDNTADFATFVSGVDATQCNITVVDTSPNGSAVQSASVQVLIVGLRGA